MTDQISDISFKDGIEFLIQKEIIKVPESETISDIKETTIPRWVKVNAAWWIDEKISDGEFSQALQYLIRVGIIVI